MPFGAVYYLLFGFESIQARREHVHPLLLVPPTYYISRASKTGSLDVARARGEIIWVAAEEVLWYSLTSSPLNNAYWIVLPSEIRLDSPVTEVVVTVIWPRHLIAFLMRHLQA